jgi:hypothetical protein
MAFREQSLRQMEADEAGGACNNEAHEPSGNAKLELLAEACVSINAMRRALQYRRKFLFTASSGNYTGSIGQ